LATTTSPDSLPWGRPPDTAWHSVFVVPGSTARQSTPMGFTKMPRVRQIRAAGKYDKRVFRTFDNAGVYSGMLKYYCREAVHPVMDDAVA